MESLRDQAELQFVRVLTLTRRLLLSRNSKKSELVRLFICGSETLHSQKYKKQVAERDELIAVLRTNLAKKEKAVGKYKCEFVSVQGKLETLWLCVLFQVGRPYIVVN